VTWSVLKDIVFDVYLVFLILKRCLSCIVCCDFLIVVV